MKNLRTILGTLVITLGFAVFFASFAQADEVTSVVGRGTPRPGVITTYNNSDHPVWITIYNNLGMNRESGCVLPHTQRDWTGYFPPLGYDVRSQMVDKTLCGPDQISDNTVGLAAQLMALGEDVYIDAYNNLKEEAKWQPFDASEPASSSATH